MRLNVTRSHFILLWIAACVAVPAAVAFWPSYIPTSPEPTALDYVRGALSSWYLFLMTALQWPLLSGRIKRSWLWPLLGIAAVIAEGGMSLMLFEASRLLPQALGEFMYFTLRAMCTAIALAATQSATLLCWRFPAGGWLVLCLFAFGIGFVAMLFSQNFIIGPVAERFSSFEGLRGGLNMFVLWAVFGLITGRGMWERLEAHQGAAAVAT